LSGACDYDPDLCADILMRIHTKGPGTENRNS
jgi:hypothetical protein